MTNLSEHGVRNYGDCFHDYSQVGRETLRCAIEIALEAKKRASRFELEPLYESLSKVERELDVVGTDVIGPTNREGLHKSLFQNGRSVQDKSLDCEPTAAVSSKSNSRRTELAESRSLIECQAAIPNGDFKNGMKPHEAAANDDIGNIIRGLEKLIEERRGHD